MTIDEFTPISLRPRWQRAADWIEKYCVLSDGADRGHSVHRGPTSSRSCWQIFELRNPPPADLGRMSAFLALIGLCGPEHLREMLELQTVEVDCWSVWRAASGEVRDVLQRRGESTICDELGTRFPAAA
jgi:hypothetical protein